MVQRNSNSFKAEAESLTVPFKMSMMPKYSKTPVESKKKKKRN